MGDDKEAEDNAVLDELSDALTPGRSFRIRKGEGTFATELFQEVAAGRPVEVRDSAGPSPFGVPGVYGADMDFMSAELARRKNYGLRLALKSVPAVAGAVVSAIVEDQVGGRVRMLKDRGADMKALIELGLGALGLRSKRSVRRRASSSKKRRGMK